MVQYHPQLPDVCQVISIVTPPPTLSCQLTCRTGKGLPLGRPRCQDTSLKTQNGCCSVLDFYTNLFDHQTDVNYYKSNHIVFVILYLKLLQKIMRECITK